MSYSDMILRLFASVVFGAIVGYEREGRGHAAGLRTHVLVSLGSALIAVINIYLFETYKAHSTIDVTRIAAQVVSGIGFLGAGTIIRSGATVRGLTTAASLWVVAAIGLATGFGCWEAAGVTTLLVMASLIMLRYLGRYQRAKRMKKSRPV